MAKQVWCHFLKFCLSICPNLVWGSLNHQFCHCTGSSSSNSPTRSNYWRIYWSPWYNIRSTNRKWRPHTSGLVLYLFSPIILDCAVCAWLWLLMQLQVVHTLTDGTVPSPDLVSTIKRLYVTKLKVIMDNVLTYSILSQLGSLFMWFCCFWSVIDSCFSGYWYSNSSTSLLIKRWGQNHPELPSIILLLLWPRVKITLLLLARFYYFFPI